MKSNLSNDLRASRAAPQDVERELSRLAPRLGTLAGRVYWFDTVGSTNDVATHLADLGADDGTIVIADAQTAGRGRLGRAWFSPPAAGLYVSIVLRTGIEPPLLTLASGVALAEGIERSTGLPCEIKWPNDLVVARRKLAGILAEAAAQGGVLQFVIVGLGVNLLRAAYPSELADRATSLEAELNRPVDRALILGEVLAALAGRYGDLREGRFDAILSAWRQRAYSLRGAAVEWDSTSGVKRGRAEDIDETGALLVQAGGKLERLVAGEIRWI